MRIFWIGLLAFLSLASASAAQDQDSIFADYDSYARYVDRQIMDRSFTELVQRLGGRDEYTPEQLSANQRQMEAVWPFDFENMSVFKEVDLGHGLRQEGRLYWTGKSYAFFYALLHQRDEDLLVLTFLLNSSSKAVLERF